MAKKFATIYITMFEHPENGGVFAEVIKPVVANLVSVQDCKTTALWSPLLYKTGKKDTEGNDVFAPKLSLI